jgi:hypothetical protein
MLSLFFAEAGAKLDVIGKTLPDEWSPGQGGDMIVPISPYPYHHNTLARLGS